MRVTATSSASGATSSTAAAYGVDQFLFVYGDEPAAGARTSELTVRTMIEEGRAYADTLSPGATVGTGAGRGGGGAMRFGAATGLRPLPAWKRAADFLFVQIGFSLDELLAWRARVDVDASPSTPASSSSPAPRWPRASRSRG